MQETRHHILSILKKRTTATVDQIVDDLMAVRGTITHVTVRHHLTKLQKDELITSDTQNRKTPGRPHLVYMLTTRGLASFPNNFEYLTDTLINQLEQTLSGNQVNVIFEGVAQKMAAQAFITATTLPERLEQITAYLNQHGYEAAWEALPQGFLLHTYHCPYHREHTGANALCRMDMALIATLLGVVPRLTNHMAEGDNTCSYFIPDDTYLR